ncbi:MAG: carbohydrate kinase family protein [Candidatus Hydrogenedentes bacterium]|nr:carbohydrate kinase family protein [Candidatus Hydrogenedentota bacterium]
MALDLVTVGVVCADVMVRPVEQMPPRGALTLVPTLEMHVGGLAGVTATVMCQLGGSAAFIGRVGHDSFGDYLVQTMSASGVDTSHVIRDPDHHSSATVVLVSHDGERSFLHHIGTTGEVSERDIPVDVIAKAKVLHWGGPSVTSQLDGAPMGRVFERVRALGVKTSMDTCYDGKNIWLPLIEPSLPYLDIVFSSLEEARKYTGQQNPPAIADFYQSYGVQTVVVKLGADGLYARHGAKSCSVPAHRVTVVDTTGAGDAACAGVLYGHLEGWDLERCARLANAVGGLTVQQMGGAEAIHSLDETLEFMENETCLNSAAS